MRETMVARRHVEAERCGPLTLEYIVMVSPLLGDLEIYGVKVVEKQSGAAACAPGLTINTRRILELIDRLSSGTVTPTGLADVLEDWL